MARLASRAGLHYGWVVAGITFMVLLTSAGLRAAPGLLIIPLETEFGWDRVTISVGISINVLLYGLTGPLAGQMLDRWGSTRVMLVGLALAAVGTGLTIFISTPLHFQLLWGLIIGLAQGLTGAVLAASLASRWFVAKQGQVMGVLGSASSAGQLIFVPLLMAIIVRAGWRPAMLILAGLAAVLLPVAAWLARDDPTDVGLEPYGGRSGAVAAKSARPVEAGEVPIWRSIRGRAFWMLAGTFFVCGATGTGLIGTHLIPHWIDVGVPEATAASAVGIMGAMNVVGAMGSGWLCDRYNARYILACIYGLRCASLVFLPFALNLPEMAVFAAIYGLDSVATVPPTVALARELFGKRSIGVTYGSITLIHQIGGALAAYAGGVAHVYLGDYRPAFFAAGLVGLLATVVALRIPRFVTQPDAVPAPV